MISSKVVVLFLGLNLYAMVETAMIADPSKGDPYGAIAAILFGSFGLGAVTLWQRIRMASIAIEAERVRRQTENDAASRKAEMASLNDRVDGQDKYIRDLESKVREFATEAIRWKTLYEQSRPTTTTTVVASPTGSAQK